MAKNWRFPLTRHRVWVVTPELHREGGTERCVVEQLERWRDRFDLSLYTIRCRDVDLVGVRVRRLWDVPGPHLLRFNWWLLANNVARRWDARRLCQPDVVYSPGVNAFDARAVGVHIVFAKYLEARRQGPGAPPVRGLVGIRSVHRFLYRELVRWLERRLYRGPASLWAGSRAKAAELERRFGRPPGTVPVVPLGVDCRAFSPAARLARRVGARQHLGVHEERVLLMVGNDWQTKGLDVAIRMLARVPPPFLLGVVGSDQLRPYDSLARELGVRGRVRFWPHCPEVLEYYAAADCLIAPSREDAFALPPLEAMACGLPVVVSRAAGVSELVDDGRDALVLTDPEDDAELARLVRRVFDEPGVAERLAIAARATAERYTWEANAEATARLIEHEATTPRVLVFAPDPWGTGGIERATRTLLRSLADLYGAERIALLAVWGPGPDATALPCRILYAGRRPPGAGEGPRVGVGQRLRYFLAALATARRWRGTRTVILVTHSHLAPVAWACRLATGVPYAVWCHGREAWGRLGTIVRRVLRRAPRLVTSSRFTAAMVAAGAKNSGDRTRDIPYALSGEFPVAAVGRGNGRGPEVLSVARLTRADAYKGIDTLILAWPQLLARVPDAQLVVVGDGDDRARLERLAARLGVHTRVQFRGRLDDGALLAAYRGAQAFALPGRVRLGSEPQGEGFGLVFLEAAAAGLPCIAGRAGGAVEAVADGETGLLVDPESPADVARALARLLEDAGLAGRMGEAGRQRVAREFSYERFRGAVADLVTDLISFRE